MRLVMFLNNIVPRKTQLTLDHIRFKRERYKKSVLSYPPRSVTIGITSYCNNKCVFCAYHSHDAKGKSNVHGLNYNLYLNDFKRIVDMCYEGRVPHVHICGTGEPFFNKEILNMIDYSINVYGKASIQTNFWKPLFEKKDYYNEIIKRAKHIEYITTDILSGNPGQHNELKKGSSYYDVLYAMECNRSQGISNQAADLIHSRSGS
jgi:2-iminoacetate synthase ThiH